jgi:3',5'-nucleoside bisphosphate phosphatase
MTADLHLHTYYSDGSWSPQQLIDEAVKLEFDCIAITDHDTVAALPEAREYAEGKIRLINGIELNTVWTNPNGEAQDVHILGYFIDPQSTALKEVIDRQQSARLKYLNEILERLASRGYEIGLDDVRASAGKGSLGRPHLCLAMVRAGVSADVQQAFKLLTDKSSDLYAVRNSITPFGAIAAIKASGGISSLAHPGKDPFMHLLIRELPARGLDAVEAYHRGHTFALLRRYLKLARKRHLLVTGGSDCHGAFENYAASIGSVRVATEVVQRLEEAHIKLRDAMKLAGN